MTYAAARVNTNDQVALLRMYEFCRNTKVRLFIRGTMDLTPAYKTYTTTSITCDGIEFEYKRGGTWMPMQLDVADCTFEQRRLYAIHTALGQVATPLEAQHIRRSLRRLLADLDITWV